MWLEHVTRAFDEPCEYRTSSKKLSTLYWCINNKCGCVRLLTLCDLSYPNTKLHLLCALLFSYIFPCCLWSLFYWLCNSRLNICCSYLINSQFCKVTNFSVFNLFIISKYCSKTTVLGTNAGPNLIFVDYLIWVLWYPRIEYISFPSYLSLFLNLSLNFHVFILNLFVYLAVWCIPLLHG